MRNERPSHHALDRRRFIKAGSLLGLGSLLLPHTLLAKPSEEGGGCDPTTDDILGPFYLPGSPVTTLVAEPNEPGTRLFISGTVLSSDCVTPVPGAMIEVWQANDAAQYDTSPNFELRATMYVDANGQYAFETIMPGAYLNGNQYRPKHIHFKITKPGFPDLITQLYFEGDPYIAADPWASQPDAAARIIPLNTLGGGDLEGVFDIVLDGVTGIKPNRYGLDGDLLPVHPNPMQDRASIHFNVFRQARVALHIADLNGRVLVTLLDEQKTQGRYTTQWDGRDAAGREAALGTYLCLFTMDGRSVKAQRLVKG
jgi:catechol 1,2-dioxygenase